MIFSKTTIKSFSIILILLFSIVFTSCAGDLESTFNDYPKWETEVDAEGSSIRWEFSGNTLKYFSVYDGEDTFTQSFNFSIEGDTLTATSDYSTLTFKIKIDGDTMTVKTEADKVLIFKRK